MEMFCIIFGVQDLIDNFREIAYYNVIEVIKNAFIQFPNAFKRRIFPYKSG